MTRTPVRSPRARRPSASGTPTFRSFHRSTRHAVRRVARRPLLVGGLVAGLAVSATALSHLPGHADQPTPSGALSAQAEARPSVLAASALGSAARTAPRASRGGARTARPPMTRVTRTVATGATFSGAASWYGGYFQGRRTANGERFDRFELTAASKTLPFGTRLRVCRTDRCVVVRINDRGPYVGSRVLDLSQAAAQELGFSGVAHVTATPVGLRTVSVVDTAAVARQRAAQQRAVQRRAVVASRQAAHNAAVRAERLQLAALTTAAPSASPWPLGLLAGGTLLAGSGGLVHLRRRRTRS